MKRCEQRLVERLPQTNLGRHAPTEPPQDVLAIRALGRCRQSEKYLWLEVLEYPLVRGSRGVMELVDDHDVEVVRGKLV